MFFSLMAQIRLFTPVLCAPSWMRLCKVELGFGVILESKRGGLGVNSVLVWLQKYTQSWIQKVDSVCTGVVSSGEGLCASQLKRV